MKTLMKRLLTATLILVTTAAMSISVFAAAITGQEAKTRALTDAGVTASEVSNVKVRARSLVNICLLITFYSIVRSTTCMA